MNENLVSIVLPVYNEEKYIGRCLDSIKNQTFPSSSIEVLVVDGMSSDKTREIVKEKSLPNMRIIDNPKRLVTYALNIGIVNCKGSVIVRMDAHAEYSNDYIEKCVLILNETEASNVGGVAETKGDGFWGNVNSHILSSKFGVGNSKFRTEHFSGYVDTVPFGAFRKEVFENIGLFDVNLPRSEDNDINSRIRKEGGKVYLSSEIKFVYYCRNTISGLLKQAILNGNSLFLTLRRNPKAMSLRHFVPFCFLLSILSLLLVSRFSVVALWVLFAELLVYSILDSVFSFRKNKPLEGIACFFLYPLFHLSYGLGSLLGLLCLRLY